MAQTTPPLKPAQTDAWGWLQQLWFLLYGPYLDTDIDYPGERNFGLRFCMKAFTPSLDSSLS
jgi:hypothetical protein